MVFTIFYALLPSVFRRNFFYSTGGFFSISLEDFLVSIQENFVGIVNGR